MDDVPLKIPLTVFRKMLHNLPVEKLRALPAESLPREVPNDILRELDDEKREVVDDLMFEVNSHHIEMRLELEQKFGEAVLPAFNQADKSFDEIARPSFVQQIQEYVALNQAYVEHPDHALADDILSMDDLIFPQINALSITRNEVEDLKKIMVERYSISGEQQSEFEEAISKLKKQEQLIDIWLGKFFGAKLKKARYELSKHKDHLQKNKDLIDDVNTQIEATNQRIKTSIKAMGLAEHEINTHHFIQGLRADINELEERRSTQKLLVPESALIDVLDVFVDASLSPVVNKDFDFVLEQTKLELFDLIALYCGDQVRSLEDAADNNFSMASQTEASEFSLKTEHFILQYFVKKTKNISGNNFKSEQLDVLSSIEKELLSLIRGL